MRSLYVIFLVSLSAQAATDDQRAQWVKGCVGGFFDAIAIYHSAQAYYPTKKDEIESLNKVCNKAVSDSIDKVIGFNNSNVPLEAYGCAYAGERGDIVAGFGRGEKNTFSHVLYCLKKYNIKTIK